MTRSSIDRPYGRLLAVVLVCVFGVAAWASPPAGVVRDSVLCVLGGVRKLPPFAFRDNDGFREVRFESPVVIEEIGDYAFLGCTRLRSVDLPASVRRIGEGAFRECSSLGTVVVPKRVAALPRYAFAWCSGLREVRLPAGLRDIGSHAFIYCGSLESVSIPASVTHVGSNAFTLCTSLREVALPPSVTELESYAFAGCSSLERAELPANGHLLGELIFSGCRALREIREMSPVPPEFDCSSTLFEPEEDYMYKRCRLVTRPDAVPLYRRAAGWSRFVDVAAP